MLFSPLRYDKWIDLKKHEVRWCYKVEVFMSKRGNGAISFAMIKICVNERKGSEEGKSIKGNAIKNDKNVRKKEATETILALLTT
ncbi:hypothetical protein CDL12_09083 [Handroanthus impetiginosus]|uniref:Uncharacterized protein n=1 Tax=Handroanthus impetiginosus TaxID=429701 RepID=A0A2G9HL52_9LAMI|nr:hypothetical protein CDL12_09083 [Handroanthus impetiginosus]